MLRPRKHRIKMAWKSVVEPASLTDDGPAESDSTIDRLRVLLPSTLDLSGQLSTRTSSKLAEEVVSKKRRLEIDRNSVVKSALTNCTRPEQPGDLATVTPVEPPPATHALPHDLL